MCDLKRDRPKNAKIFCKTFVHDCLILPHREPIDIPYPGRFRYVLIAICNTYFRLTRFKLQVFTRSKIPTQATKQAMPALYSGGDIFCQPDKSHCSLRVSSPIAPIASSPVEGLSERRSREASRSRVLARLASLAQIGELARRLVTLVRNRVHEYLTSGIC